MRGFRTTHPSRSLGLGERSSFNTIGDSQFDALGTPLAALRARSRYRSAHSRAHSFRLARTGAREARYNSDCDTGGRDNSKADQDGAYAPLLCRRNGRARRLRRCYTGRRFTGGSGRADRLRSAILLLILAGWAANFRFVRRSWSWPIVQFPALQLPAHRGALRQTARNPQLALRSRWRLRLAALHWKAHSVPAARELPPARALQLRWQLARPGSAPDNHRSVSLSAIQRFSCSWCASYPLSALKGHDHASCCILRNLTILILGVLESRPSRRSADESCLPRRHSKRRSETGGPLRSI